jgi:hypothetical protein
MAVGDPVSDRDRRVGTDLTSYLDGLWVSLFPFFAEPPGYSLGAILESWEILDRLVGAWWFFALFVVNAIFNTILGEKFLFRGVLLPCSLALPALGIPGSVISGVFLYAFPSWRFRSTWMGIIVHSAQSVYFAFLIFGIVLGLA